MAPIAFLHLGAQCLPVISTTTKVMAQAVLEANLHHPPLTVYPNLLWVDTLQVYLLHLILTQCNLQQVYPHPLLQLNITLVPHPLLSLNPLQHTYK